MSQRLARLRGKLTEKQYDGMLVSQGENRRYLSGFTGSAGYLLITQDAAVLFTDFRYTEQAGLQAKGFTVQQVSGGFENWLTGMVRDLNVKRLAFDALHITYATHQAIKKALAELEAELVPDEQTVELLRAVKEPSEVAAIEKAQGLTDGAYHHLLEVVRPGMTEVQVAWELERFIRENGGDGLAFGTIVAAEGCGATVRDLDAGSIAVAMRACLDAVGRERMRAAAAGMAVNYTYEKFVPEIHTWLRGDGKR